MDDNKKSNDYHFEGFGVPRFTPVPDVVFDELLSVLTANEVKPLLYIIRRTYGFKKDSDNISLSQMLNGIVKKDGTRLDNGVGLSKPTLLRALKSLAEKDIIVTERRASKEKGYESTNYSLRMKEDPLGKRMNQGLYQNFTKPLVKERYIQQTDVQETVLQEHVNVASNKNGAIPSNGTSPDPRLEDVITRMAERLGDKKQGSRVAFAQILNVLGESITERLVGNTLETYQEGKISSTRAKYFMGMAKKVAKEAGKDLGFKEKGSPTSGLTKPEENSIHAQIATLTAEMGGKRLGSRGDEQIPVEGGQALTQMFEAYQRGQGRR